MSLDPVIKSYVDIARVQLPTRAEKRLVPFISQPTGSTVEHFFITPAMKRVSCYEYMAFRLPGRGLTVEDMPDPNKSAYFKFLINPSQVSVNKQTMDVQSLTKGGWQIGVQGEDFTTLTVQGKTPGRYFFNGLTDYYAEYSMSYRNLADLELLVENNGCWFEGEQVNEGPLAASSLRRRIKMHQDIELTAGEFVWTGMFENLTISEDAETPFLANFSFSFVAWKERFRKGTPYRNAILNQAPTRGHSATVPGAIPTTGHLSNTAIPLAPAPPLAGADKPGPGPLADVLSPATGIFAG